MKGVFIGLALVLIAGACGFLIYGIILDRGGGDGSDYIRVSSFAAVAGAIVALLVPMSGNRSKSSARKDD